MANVLVVDDIPDVADSCAEVVTLFGDAVRIAHNGTQALHEIEICPPEVVLVDLTPEELQERLRAGKVYPRERAEVALQNFFRYENLEKNIPIGVCESMEEAYRTHDRVRRSGAIVLPMLDPEVMARYPDGRVSFGEEGLSKTAQSKAN